MATDVPDIGSWNPYWENSVANIKKGLQALIDVGADIIGLQEMSHDPTWAAIAKWTPTIGWWTTPKSNAIPIHVNTKIYEVVDWKSVLYDNSDRPVEPGAGGDTAPTKSIMRVSVRHRADRTVSHHFNLHLIATIEKDGQVGGGYNPLRLAFAQGHLDLLKKLARPYVESGDPVTVSGDWNVSSSTDAGAWLRRQLEPLGFVSAQDHLGPFNTQGVREIDDVFYANCEATKFRRLDEFGSDHSPIQVDLRPVPAPPPFPEPAPAEPSNESEEPALPEYGPKEMYAIFTFVDRHEPSAVMSGVVGNAAHKRGYHRCRAVVSSDDYSVKAPADRRGDRYACSAIDIKFPDGPRSAMTRVSGRLMKACRPETFDPRAEPIREWFGTLNGTRVTGYNRYSVPGVADRAVGLTSSDPSHLWHIHVSVFRAYCTDDDATRGIAEIIAGIPLSKSTTRHRTGPAAEPVIEKPPAVEPASIKPKIDLSNIQAAIRAGTVVVDEAASKDGTQLQSALNRRMGTKLTVDGELGRNTRTVMALAQAKLAKGDPDQAWPNRGHLQDFDGIPGRESLTWLGFNVQT